MSLTLEGYRERKWDHFPALRQVLEDKKLRFNHITSADNTFFDGFHRLMEIAALAKEYDKMIREASNDIGVEHMCEDLAHLETGLDFIKGEIGSAIDAVKDVRRSVCESASRRRL